MHAPSEAKVSRTENINLHAVAVNWMDYTRFHAIESALSFPVSNLANDLTFLGFYFKTRCSKK